MLFLLIFLSVLFLRIVQSHNECTLENGRTGLCYSIDKCKNSSYYIENSNQILKNCSTRSTGTTTHLVCCPEQKSVISCRRYLRRKHFPVLIIGNPAKAKEFAHMAAIGYGSKESIRWLCGGTLISNQFVLTAAHCVHSQEFGSVKWIRLGDLDLQSTTDDAKPQDFNVSEIFVYPNYTRSSHYHDIALLKLEEKAKFNPYVDPACLHIANSDPDRFSVTGWGVTSFGGSHSSHLLKTTLFSVDNKKCNTIYFNASKRKLKNGIVESLQICAGHPEGKDTCSGDSGGPLQYNEGIIVRILGITSFGKACGVENSAGVYTRIAPYRTWIEDIVWPEL